MSTQEHSFDNSQLPDWAIHSDDEQDELSAFFNGPADRGEAETAFTIPRGSHEPTPQAVPVSEQAVTEELPEQVQKPAGEKDHRATKRTTATTQPHREDFARFRCIYESRDGQLALYEDGEGHLTAVNTNRFI